MLKITIPASEQFDPVKSEFITTKEQTLVMEHSLISLSKWEEKWKKPFLSTEQKTQEESLDYLKCMTITQNVDPNVYLAIDPKTMEEINAYMEDSHTATWFAKTNEAPSREIITAELLYYAMFANGVDKECEKWHLNKLMTLLRVFAEKNKPEKKMTKSEILSRNRALNKSRLQRLKRRG
jgi:hypothetical protein